MRNRFCNGRLYNVGDFIKIGPKVRNQSPRCLPVFNAANDFFPPKTWKSNPAILLPWLNYLTCVSFSFPVCKMVIDPCHRVEGMEVKDVPSAKLRANAQWQLVVHDCDFNNTDWDQCIFLEKGI